MKRSTFFCLVTLLIAMAGCDDKTTNTCGNYILDEGELCDGSLFNKDLVVRCEDGRAGDKAALKCNESCTIDLSDACKAKCGNNIIDQGEECDGTSMPVIQTNCSNPDMTKLSCEACKIVDHGVCGGAVFETCGNGQLDEDELCDGENIRESAKICPDNMFLSDAAKFKCLSTCRLVDASEACEFAITTCGNGALNEDKGEMCDGKLFSENITFEPCPQGMYQEHDNLVCTNNCKIDSSRLCVPESYILLSEVLVALEDAGEYMTIGGIALELTNMGKSDFDASECSLKLYQGDGTLIKDYKMPDWNIDTITSKSSLVICSQSQDHFNGLCDATISDTADLIQKNLSNAGFMAMVCDGEYVDVFNMNSFIAAVNRGGVDFMRTCDAFPVTDPANALLGEGWVISPENVANSMFGLGEHCTAQGLSVESCTYTVSRNTLTERSQSIEQQLDIKIPGLTTKTNQTDYSASVAIRFVVGKVSGNKVTGPSIIHIVWPQPDASWSSSDGIDRYIGVLHNVDVNEGFIDGDEGSYVMDAAISFDNAQTWTYCGPNGIISDYKTLNAGERNQLEVYYEGSTCGDNIVNGSEVCDGSVYLEEALVCETPGQVVTDRSKLKCYNCSMLSTANACSEPISTCGNNQVDGTREVCDGNDIPASARVCPENMVLKDNPEFICNDTCSGIDIVKACEPACGNGKLDEGEICDGNLLDEEAARTYAKCENKNSVFDLSRANCHACNLDMAVCVPNTPLVLDEYLVKLNQSNTPIGVAVTVNNYGTEPIPLSGCSFSLVNVNGTLLQYIPLTDVAGSEDAVLSPCQPLVICSEPTETQQQYQQYFGECDATLSGNVLVNSRSSIDRIQLSCMGNFVDYFDYSGMVSALSENYIHGKLKSSEHKPWPSSSTVVLKDRMDLDSQFNLTTFGQPVCE